MDTSFCQLKGYARVLKGASGARSFVHERGILLDKGARVDGLPDMSVDESDVKATHSSATAPVDEETVFYLMSKGIPEVGVKKLIVSGFLSESISKMHNGGARNLAIELINHKLETQAVRCSSRAQPGERVDVRRGEGEGHVPGALQVQVIMRRRTTRSPTAG